jgi:hypothetical protein
MTFAIVAPRIRRYPPLSLDRPVQTIRKGIGEERQHHIPVICDERKSSWIKGLNATG